MKRTVTYDDELCKFVPIEPTEDQNEAGLFAGSNIATKYRAMIAAAPTNLHGVIEHSGEPVARINSLNGSTCTSHLQKLPDGLHDLYAHAAPATNPPTLWRVETLKGNRYFTHEPTPGIDFGKSGYLRTVALAECGASDKVTNEMQSNINPQE